MFTQDELSQGIVNKVINEIPNGEAEKEKRTETTVEATSSTIATEQVQTEQNQERQEEVKVFDYFNKKFNTTYQSDEDLQVLLNNANKGSEADSYLNKIKEYETLVEDLKGQINPRKYFASDDDFLREQFKIKFPDKNYEAVNRLYSKPIDQMSEEEQLIIATQLDYPQLEGGIDGVKAVLGRQMGIDFSVDKSEWGLAERNLYNIAVTEAKNRLNKYKNEVKLPESVDYVQQIASRKEQNNQRIGQFKEQIKPIIAKQSEGLKELSFGFTDGENAYNSKFNFKPEFINNIGNLIEDHLIENGLEITPENLKEAGQQVLDVGILIHFNDIIKAVYRDGYSKADEYWRKELNGSTTINSRERIDQSSDMQTLIKDQENKVRKLMGL